MFPSCLCRIVSTWCSRRPSPNCRMDTRFGPRRATAGKEPRGATVEAVGLARVRGVVWTRARARKSDPSRRSSSHPASTSLAYLACRTITTTNRDLMPQLAFALFARHDPPWLALRLKVRFDEPQPLVNAPRYLSEQVSRVQVAQLVGLADRLSGGLAKRRKGA